MALTKDDIAAARDVTPEPYEVPEWGGEVYLRPLTGADRAAAGARSKGASDSADKLSALNAWFLSKALCDESGRMLFADEKEAAILLTKNGAVIERIVKEVLRRNRMTQESADELGKD